MINTCTKNKILLLRPNGGPIKKTAHPRAIRPPYLLKYTEALLEKEGGFEIQLVDCLSDNITLKALYKTVDVFKPDVICIYQLGIDERFTLDFIQRASSSYEPVFILCGQGVLGDNMNGDQYKKENVLIIKGEAEEEILSVAKAVRAGRSVSDINASLDFSLRHIVADPDQLPVPKYTLKEITKYAFCYPLRQFRRLKWGHILSGRGCPYACIFCSSVMRESYGKNMRLRSAKNIVDEIVYQKQLGVNVISFDDDDFTADHQHVYSVCNELIERQVNLPWIVHARVDEVDEEMLKLMKRAGCVLLRFGIESASERILLKLHKGNPRRWIEMTKNAFTKAHDIGIGTVALFFIGAPEERREDVEASIALAKEIDPDILQVSFFTPYPGSTIYEEVKDSLKPDDVEKLYHYSAPLLNLSHIDTEELVLLQKRFYKEVVFRRVFLIKHVQRFFAFYIRNLHLTFSLLKGVFRTVAARI